MQPNLQSLIIIHRPNREVFAAAPRDKGTPVETEGAEETGVLADTSHLLERDTWSLVERGEDDDADDDADGAKVIKKSNGGGCGS